MHAADDVDINRKMSIYKHRKKQASNDAQLLMYVVQRGRFVASPVVVCGAGLVCGSAPWTCCRGSAPPTFIMELLTPLPLPPCAHP